VAKSRIGGSRRRASRPGPRRVPVRFDSLRTARGSANVIQAQRDYFGSHTYERLDAPGEAVHTNWKPKAF
jgi:6-phosphogluconate dehydrogenase